MAEEKVPEKRPIPRAAASTPAGTEDLSEAINQLVERQPHEEVRSVWVFDDHYRCNWWVKGESSHLLSFSSGFISKSKFLRVTKVENTLLIEDVHKDG